MTLTPERLHEAVELADGWKIQYISIEDEEFIIAPGSSVCYPIDDEFIIAALASQLISQVDAMEPELSITATAKYIHLSGPQGHILTIEGPNRDDRPRSLFRAIEITCNQSSLTAKMAESSILKILFCSRNSGSMAAMAESSSMST